MRRSSVAIGICSGALTVASACGLPAIFLQTKRGYSTADLACFSPGQTFEPDEALHRIAKLLASRSAYSEARALALHNGLEYYSKGDYLPFSGLFFERLLQDRPASIKN
jgi:hypothetical protein